jgi:hypothetical protein
LLFYIVMELLAGLCHVVLTAAGFKLQQLGGISYYTIGMGPQQLVQAIVKPLASQQQQQQQQQRKSHQGTAERMEADSPPAAAESAGAFAAGRSAVQQQLQQQHDEDDGDALPIVFLHGVGAGLLPYLSLVFHLASLGENRLGAHSSQQQKRLRLWWDS